jgi:catechol 2,3-dioxygenase-like lactoylglutathione lyase family enzyme
MTQSAGGRRPVIREVFPYLCVRDAAAALEFYTAVFGAEELLRLTDAGGRDPFGHEWLLGHELEALSSEELKQRFEAEQRA